jgi:hypothetical protein
MTMVGLDNIVVNVGNKIISEGDTEKYPQNYIFSHTKL